MKKLIALLLALVMVLALVACGAQTDAPAADAPAADAPAADAPAADAPAADAPAADAPAADAPLAPGEYAAFDEYPHPVVKPDGALKIGVMAESLTSESIYRWDWQLQVECAHRGWEYVSLQYKTADNFEATFQSGINQGCDAIVLVNTASAAQWADLYNKAREQGIGIYSLDQGYGGYIAGACSPGYTMMAELVYQVGSDYNWDLECAVIRADNQQGSRDRTFPLLGFFDYEAYPDMNLVVTEDVSAISPVVGGSMMAGLEVGKTWMEKYGTEIECVFSYGDNSAMGMAEAIMATGDTTGENTFVVGIDGGKQSWSYIRNGEPLKYSYAQGFELQAHMIAEIIDQIQVQGLNPGDEGCDVAKSHSMLFVKGGIVTIDNVPEVGTSIHQAFDYYDPTVTDPEAAWWNWTDGPGIYLVEAYEG
ncbi:MAG: substrate-binding domain-containing protein [Oscillospiraceae bacterium]|nr:substrate-binding domain-containing protein [Oscillospiraceae bacterium]